MKGHPQTVRRDDSILIEPRSARRGATLVEVLVVIGIASILLSLLIPAVQSSRESARAASCRNRLKQITLAAHSYQSLFGTFPYTATAWAPDGKPVPASSPHMGLFPYLAGTSSTSLSADFTSIPAWNGLWPPRFFTPELTAQQSEVTPVFLCPHPPFGHLLPRGEKGRRLSFLLSWVLPGGRPFDFLRGPR